MNNKRLKFGYEDTDKKIEIELYGLVFEIKNLENIERFNNIDKDNSEVIEEELENILGKGAIEKINNKRISDGYEKLNLNIELNIFGCIFETYAKETVRNITGKITNVTEDLSNDMNSKLEKINNLNRAQRRNNNRRYRRNNTYRRY